MKEIRDLKDLAISACRGIYSNPEATAERNINDYSNDLRNLLAEIPIEYHSWVTTKYVSLYRAWLGSQTSIYSSFISGASNYPVARMNKLNGWADNHYKKFTDWREDIVNRVKRWEKKKNYSLSSEIEEQEEKLSELKEWQDTMKAINKVVRNKKLTEEDVSDELANFGISKAVSHKLLNPTYSYEKKGFQTWQLSNNNAKIKNTEARIKELQKRLDAEGKENESYTINKVKVEKDIAENRIKLFFPSKPDKQFREKLVKSGFRWSPNNGCWQAYPSTEWKVKDLLTDYIG